MTIGTTLEETQRLQKEELHKKIDAMAETMYGITDAKSYKDYILGIMFYRYLCEREEAVVFERYKASVDDCYALRPADLEAYCINGSNLGFFIKPKYLFSKMVEASNRPATASDTFSYTDLRDAILDYNEMVSRSEAKEAYENLLDGIKLDIVELGETPAEKSANVGSIIKQVASIDIDFKTSKIDLIGETYEYIIGKYSDISASSKTGSFYTPKAIAEILARITCHGRKNVDTAYDPTSGSCSLLMSVKHHIEHDNSGKVKMFYSQELVPETYNLGRMNMILHGVKYNEFKAYRGNTLTNPQPSLEELKGKFDIIVANFPYSTSVGATNDKPALISDEKLAKDERFNKYGAYPTDVKKGDYAFIEHILYCLNDDGVAAIVCPNGVLFRSGKEETIRTSISKTMNLLDTVISLPENTFQNTPIPVCVLVFKKNKTEQDILFIDASNKYEHKNAVNYMREADINDIINAYISRKDADKFAHKAEYSEMDGNEWNLNVTRYVDTFIDPDSVDLNSTISAYNVLEGKIDGDLTQLNKLLKSLGLPEFGETKKDETDN